MIRSFRPPMPPASLTWLKAVSMPSFIWRPRSLTGPVKAAVMPNRISVSDTPRTALTGFPKLTAGAAAGAAAKAGATGARAGAGAAAAGAGADGASDCSSSASRRSASLQSVLPDVTALRPSATLRSNSCARSERWASLEAASRINAANFSITDWIRGRVTSGQASAEPITGPTRPARSRTNSILSPGAASAAVRKKALSKSEVQRRFTKIRTTQLLG
jgi:hypothetical protein